MSTHEDDHGDHVSSAVVVLLIDNRRIERR